MFFKIKKMLVISLLLCVTGCHQKTVSNRQETKTQTTIGTTVTSSVSSTDSTVLQSEAKSSIETSSSSTVQYNGSYYFVTGKYGEVIIVNKKYPLSPDYGYGEDSTALFAFQNLLSDMRGQGFDVSNQYSGFRSYSTQANLYQTYVSNDGQANADRYSARAGYSEHQTGLAFDIMDSSGALLEEPYASQWLRDHAHEYGFIVRYLPGKEHITGYMAESWHIRYIGAEAADVFQSGLTLEEYFNIPGGDYE